MIKKIGQPRSGNPICLITSTITQTELDDTKSCYQLIITITISEKIYALVFGKRALNTHCPKLGKLISPAETLSSLRPFWKIPQWEVGRVLSGCCYGYCDKSVIGGFS